MSLSHLRSAVGAGITAIFHPSLLTLTNLFGGDTVNTAIRNSTATWTDSFGITQTAQVNEPRIEGSREVRNLAALSDTPATQNITVVVGRSYQVTIGATSANGSTAVCSGAFVGTLTGDATNRRAINTNGAAIVATTTTLAVTTTGAVTELLVADITGMPANYVPEYVPRDTPIGAELSINGTFNTGISPWFSSDGVPVLSWDTVGKRLRTVYNGGGGNRGARESITGLTIGRSYTISVSIEVISGAYAALAVYLLNGALVNSIYGLTNYLELTFTATSTTILIGLINAPANSDIYFDNVSLKEASTGHKLYDTDSGNTVLNNAVTEAVGLPLHPTKLVDSSPRYETYSDWPVSTAITVGDKINLGGYWHTATGSGTTGATAPAINTTIGGTFSDNAVTWRNDGQYSGIALLVEPAATNLYPLPEAVVTQTFSVAVGDNTLSMDGTGSLAITAGTATATGYATATEGTDVTINVTVAGTVTCTPTGSVTKAQMEAGSVSTSFTPSIRASETGNINWPIAGNFDNLKGFFVADVNMALLIVGDRVLSLNGAVSNSLLYLSAANTLAMTDGTLVATVAATPNKWVRVIGTWDTGGNMQLSVIDLQTYGAAYVDGVAVAYDGGFAQGTKISYGDVLTAPLHVRNVFIEASTPVLADIKVRYT